MRRFLLPCAAALLLAGCQSYDVVQTNIFSDDDGKIVRVDYGRSDSDHINTFVNPATGREMEFRSRLVVSVVLPNGDSITAWQCMNFLSSGTMYKTDNEKWMVLMSGFTCRVYRRTKEDKSKYLEVYCGILCESPESDYEPDDRWKKVRDPSARGPVERKSKK